MKKRKDKAIVFLNKLNKEYYALHKKYEEPFWLFYMGDQSFDTKKDAALAARDAFRGNVKYLTQAKGLLQDARGEKARRLQAWVHFFEHYQSSPKLAVLKNKLNQLETELMKKKGNRVEGYTDPYTKKFVQASYLKMRTMIRTNSDEKMREAYFHATERLAEDFIPEYIEMIHLRNAYARELGYTDFYDFKVRREDGMTKKELFSLFDSIHQKTKNTLAEIRKMEKQMPGLRKPWNFGYMMSGDFTKEEDPYFQFDDALLRWGRSFSAMGIDFKGGTLQLDLLDRKGKYENGFCHWPELVHFENGTRKPGGANFTCNVVAGQTGSGINGFNTLFHEGGHAAHLLNSEMKDVFLNHEYWPVSASWAETQSMFLDTVFSSIEWKTRYAQNKQGESYPFDLYERKLRKLNVLGTLQIQMIIFISNYERAIYEEKNLTREKVIQIAHAFDRKYNDYSEDSIWILNVSHLYSWEFSASYHGYGLAELALSQWREYFYKKYGYIVDNPNVGREMAKVWKLGGSHTFKEFVKIATGKNLSAQPFLNEVTLPLEKKLALAKGKIARLQSVKKYTKPVRLNVKIRMVDGKNEIANNKKGFEAMAEKYGAWVRAKAANK